MAKIIFLDGSEIRGKVGGKVYSRNASGAFVRQYVKPVNANSSLQQSVRNNFASLSGAYRDLSDANRATYENMRTFYKTTDSVGNVVTPTAPQLFNRLNGVLLQNGEINVGGVMTTCPAPVPLIGINNVTPTYVTGTTTLHISATFANGSASVPAGQALIVSATTAISAGIAKVPSKLFSRIISLSTGVDTTSQNVATAYNNVYSIPTAGDTVYIRLQTYATATGQITSEVIAPMVVS
jgi:hypothetical protein